MDAAPSSYTTRPVFNSPSFTLLLKWMLRFLGYSDSHSPLAAALSTRLNSSLLKQMLRFLAVSCSDRSPPRWVPVWYIYMISLRLSNPLKLFPYHGKGPLHMQLWKICLSLYKTKPSKRPWDYCTLSYSFGRDRIIEDTCWSATGTPEESRIK